MHPIYLARLGSKVRPAVVLTREVARPAMTKVTVAPITGTVKGLASEVPVGPANGLDKDSAISCDNIITIDKGALGRHVGFLFERQEHELASAIVNAFALRTDDMWKRG